MSGFNLPMFVHSQKISRRDLSQLCSQLSLIINAGIPLLSGLFILLEQEDNSILRNTLEKVCRSLEDGDSFSSAISKHPCIFPPIMVSMVVAGEAGGILGSTLKHTAFFLDWESKVYQKIRASSTYPMIVLFCSFLAINFVLIFIMPVFGQVFDHMDIQVPLITRIFLKYSQIFYSYWHVILGIVLFTPFGLKRVKIKGFKGQEFFDYIFLKMPVLGEFIRNVMITRFCRTMASLLEVGIPIVSALEIVEKTSANNVITRHIARARLSIIEGDGMVEPLSQSKMFTPLVIQMIVVGEETGSLAAMLGKAADFYGEEVDNLSLKLTTVLEPLLIIFVGMIVCIVLLSVFLPMFKIIGSIG